MLMLLMLLIVLFHLMLKMMHVRQMLSPNQVDVSATQANLLSHSICQMLNQRHQIVSTFHHTLLVHGLRMQTPTIQDTNDRSHHILPSIYTTMVSLFPKEGRVETQSLRAVQRVTDQASIFQHTAQ